MFQIKRILAPTDLSELSQDGIRAALEIAKFQGAEITIYHVIELEDVFRDRFPPHPERSSLVELIEERRKLLAHFVEENFTDLILDLKILQAVDVGVPYRKILDRTADEHTDLIVMSTHGRTGLLHGLIGSVAEIVVRLASCPVLTVHPAKRQHKVETQAA